MTFDHTHYYRITTRLSGKEQALDVVPDGSGRVTLAEPAESSGQYWRLIPVDAGRYALRTAYLGDGLSLTVNNQYAVSLSPTTLSTGQSWNLQSHRDGTCALINDLAGLHTCLRLRKYHAVTTRLASGRPRHPRWRLIPLTPVPGQMPVPDLRQAPDVYCSEGCTDFAFYARPLGDLKCVMIFVDFPDAPAGTVSPDNQAAHLLGNGQAQQLFHDQSYGAFTLTVNVLSHLG